eukprot:CAMPEP_0171467272 /NCGR_PEP_ID=MMETSP0945-20130129/9848_1 /TAXON_ID=109269 /ORGANISM="Vaucheria litorea, Strain CCMP2940" /LENGTH=739 /DNA_ID=CAMNT_0011995709 /DNA_START=59 /DNA_END=2278 /DNA_ORIENTATION=-
MPNRSKGLQIIIAGAPASGKGTQCELIRETYGVVHLSTGDMLRHAAEDPNDEVGKIANEYMTNGNLVPDDVIIKVILNRLKMEDCCEKGWLLDGFPRTGAQAEALKKGGYYPDIFIFLDVPDSLLVERVTGRRLDPATGKIYHLKFSPPENEEIEARLVQREDDTEEKVKVRIAAFHNNLTPITSSYEQHFLCVHGDQKPDLIFKRIKGRLDRIKRYNVVFVLGGPGSGKGTQCANIVRDFKYAHFSAGDLLREAQNSGSEVGEMIKEYIKEGKIVPVKVTIELIKDAMEKSGERDFLIDGFPRSFENLKGWFDVLGDLAEVSFVLFFDCKEEVMQERLLARGATSGRTDDNIQSIAKRFATFKYQSMPVVDAFKKVGKVRVIDSSHSPEVIFKRVSQLFRGLAIVPPTERTFLLVSPTFREKVGEKKISNFLKENDFVTVDRSTKLLIDEMVDEIFPNFKEREDYDSLKKDFTSGLSIGFSLERLDAIRFMNSLINDEVVVSEAKLNDPEGFLAMNGTQGLFCSASTKDAIEKLGIWFPEPTPTSRTFAMIKPGTSVLSKDDILSCLAARGFEISKSITLKMPKTMAAEFYAEHEGKPFFDSLIAYMTSDEITALEIKKQGAIMAWRSLMGPTDSNIAKVRSPDSIRALFGVNGQRNATHGSDSKESAARELMFWFPERFTDGESAAGEEKSAHVEIKKYMSQSVDPVLAPILQKLIVSRPEDVEEFIVKALQSKGSS